MAFNTQLIHGFVDQGFEEVEEEFIRNFKERGELGAACAVYHKGKKVVDLWGGIRDHTTNDPWEENTMVGVFSTTKGIASMAIAHAHSHGLLDFDALVAHYWPAFAQNGKDQITVRQLLNHQAGLCAIDEPLDLEKLADPDIVGAAIAKQKPAWEPGTKHGYHGITLGWYESELLRQVDPKNRTIGQYFRDEIAAPLGLEFYIGLPPEIPRSRVARIKGYQPWQMLFHLKKLPGAFVKGMLNPRSLTARSFSNPKVLGIINKYNEPVMQALELPASNGIGEVRSIAKAYSEFAMGGKTIGLTPETLEALHQPAVSPRDGLFDQVLRIDTSFSLGYLKRFPAFQFGSSDKVFGTPGAGGSFGFADPDAELSFAYAMNKSGFYMWNDPREEALRAAVYRSLR